MEEDVSSKLEKRRFPRLKDNIFIRGILRSDPIEEFKAFTNNISGGGLMFEIEKNISKESKLELEIYQPVDRNKRVILSIPVMTRVIWTREIEKDNFEECENKHRVGIEFLEIKEEDRRVIAKYVEVSLSKK